MGNFQYSQVVREVIGVGIRVHRSLGPGLLESTYEKCLMHLLKSQGLRVERQVPMPVVFDGQKIDGAYRLDLFVEREVVVEVKCVDRFIPVHKAQILTYLRLSGAKHGLLLNFNSLTLKEGLRSFIRSGQEVPIDESVGNDLPV